MFDDVPFISESLLIDKGRYKNSSGAKVIIPIF